MSENIFQNSISTNINDIETEDGEINEHTTVNVKIKKNENNSYYPNVTNAGNELNCGCCGDVFSDPVKLKCNHIIDRSCAATRKNGNYVQCFLCNQNTLCDEIYHLVTDFDIASRLPSKHESLLSKITKSGDLSANIRQVKEEKKISAVCTDDELCGSDDGSAIPKKRQRKSRWDKVEETSQTSVSGAITDILSSHNSPKNITMSQFKKFTEISNKSSIMNILTEVLINNANEDINKRNSKKSGPYSDTEILEMIPPNELSDFFELEKIQFIMLYRDALDKGVILPSTNSKSPKQPLLPTPKPSSHDFAKSKVDTSPKSPRKNSSSDSSDSEFYDRSSIASSNASERSQKHVTSDSKLPKQYDIKSSAKKSAKSEPKLETVLDPREEKPKEKVVDVVTKSIEPSKTTVDIVPSATDGCTTEEAVKYRESVNQLHSIYSSMYHASIKMKELEKQIQSVEYKQAYNTYSENYTEYHKLYSSLQTAISIDSVVTDKLDSASVSEKSAPILPGVNHEQASSTISPCNYAPDSTELLPENKLENVNLHQNRVTKTTKSDIAPSLSELRQYKKLPQKDKKKFGYLWISNLCKETKTSDLCKLFSKFGHVSKIKLFQYKAQVPTTFFSLIFMPNMTEAEAACRELQNSALLDRHIHIKMLESNPLSDDRVA